MAKTTDHETRAHLEASRDEIAKMGAWTPLQIRAAVLALIAMALWLTDFLHGISPSIIGLGIGFCAVVPAEQANGELVIGAIK